MIELRAWCAISPAPGQGWPPFDVRTLFEGCYFLVDSSLRQHSNTSRDWRWLGKIPCQIYIPESRSWSFPFVCKITRTGRSLIKFPSPQHFRCILQAEGEISATQVYNRWKGEYLLDKFPEVSKNSMTYYEDIGICIEQFAGTCFYCRKRTSFGVRKATRLFHWKVCDQRATFDRRTPTLDWRTHFSMGWLSIFLAQFTSE